MDVRILSIIYITLFVVLSILLYFVMIPANHEYKEYRKSRRILGTAFLAVGIIGTLRVLYPPTRPNGYTDFLAFIGLCYIFTFLNYLSFLYIIETSAPVRKQVMKIAIVFAPILCAVSVAGYYDPYHIKGIKIALACVCTLMHFFLLTASIREYDKFTLQISNYYSNYPNLRWIPYTLWATFLVACITTGSVFYKPLVNTAGITALCVYTFLTLKILSLLPESIHTVRTSMKNKEILAPEHHEHTAIFPIAESETGKAEAPEVQIHPHTIQEPQQAPSAQEIKDAKRNEKIAILIDKWVADEKYTQSEINIKEAATQMGTNSNYLSTYINNVLDTTFAIWLNTLRIERSKEYLTGNIQLSIEECGMKVGYQTLYNYSRWFKAVTGVSPSEWRRNNKTI